MKVRYTELSGASGSIGGVTAARNRGGNYRRVRVAPLNPQSSFQIAVRGALAALSTAWRDTLSAAQRTAWEVYANTVTATDSLGQAVKLTGLNAFIAGNSVRLQAAQSAVLAAPSDTGSPVFTLPGEVALTASTTGGSVALAFNITTTDGFNEASGGGVHVYISPAVTESIRYYKGPFRYWSSKVRAGTPLTANQAISGGNPFPVVGGNGLYHYIKFVSVDAQGRKSNEYIVRVPSEET